MNTLSDDERMDAIGDGWSEIYRAQDEAEAERLGAWVCPVDRTMVPLGENCSECGCHPSTCECPDCSELRDEDDAFVYEPDEIGTSDHYYRGLGKPSGDDEWWLYSQEEEDDEP